MYGDEVAIYFEWMTQFQKHLLFPAIFALVTYVANQTVYTAEKSPFSACFSVFMTFWGVYFLVSWSRQQRSLSIEWDVHANKVNEFMHVRKEFRGQVRLSQVSDKPDLHFDFKRRLSLFAVSFAICVPCLLACMFIIVCFLNCTGVIRPEHHGGVFDMPMLSRLADEGAIFDPNSYMNFVPSIAQTVVTLLINI